MSRVLRMQPGDECIAPDEGWDYVCRIVQVERELVRAKVLEKKPCVAEPQKKIALYLAYMKADKMEFALQKAVELGVSEFRPFVSQRCVKVPDAKSSGKAVERLRRIAFEAVKQCGRARQVEVAEPVLFDQMLEELQSYELALFCYESSQGSLKAALGRPARSIGIIVGPEGGFTEEEAACIQAAGGISVSLGRRILRGETAAIAATAIVAYETEC